MTFGADAGALEYLVARAKSASRRPLIVKLSPNVTSITQMARVAELSGADALSLVNTFLGMAIDAETRQPTIRNVTGGLSGPAIKPLALRCVWQVAQGVPGLPIIGVGGISSLDDVMEYLVCGASAIQVGTANFYDPGAAPRLVDELSKLVESEGWPDLRGIIGTLRPPAYIPPAH